MVESFTNETIIGIQTIQMAMESCGLNSDSRRKCEMLVNEVDEEVARCFI